MKAKHRHELKTNELAEWIANLPQWAKENLRTITIICVVAVLAIGACSYLIYQKKVVSIREQIKLTNLITRLSHSRADILNARSRGMDISHILVQIADNLGIYALTAKSNDRAAVALIERAKALRAELHYRPGTVSVADLTAQVMKAKDSYNNALAKSPSPSLRAMAEFGLGLCEEELGNFEEARRIYGDLVADPNLEGTTTIVRAKQRLETMADYQQKVVFRPRPRPTLPPAMEPPIPLRPPEINLPGADLVGPIPVETIVAGPNLIDTNITGMTGLDINVADINLPDINLGGP